MSREWTAGQKLEPVRLDLTLRRAVQAVAGTRDYYPVHHDERFARENGAETIFFNTMFLQGFVGRAATEWFGHDAFLRRLEVAMQGSSYVGRELAAEGVVAGSRESNGCQMVDVEAQLKTEDGPVASARFAIQLPVNMTPEVSGLQVVHERA